MRVSWRKTRADADPPPEYKIGLIVYRCDVDALV